MTDLELMQAARYPFTGPQQRGTWRIDQRRPQTDGDRERMGCFPTATYLSRAVQSDNGATWREVVMTDTERALRRWLPLWRRAEGRVLLSGLGIGCAARGLLARPEVVSVDIIEADQDVIDMVGPTIESDRSAVLNRHLIIHEDAHRFAGPEKPFDWAWHDLSIDALPTAQLNEEYDKLHRALVEHFRPFCRHQGFFAMPESVVVY